jgi:hypothetical protein
VKERRNKAKKVNETRKRKQLASPPYILLVVVTETLDEQSAGKIKRNERDTPPM